MASAVSAPAAPACRVHAAERAAEMADLELDQRALDAGPGELDEGLRHLGREGLEQHANRRFPAAGRAGRRRALRAQRREWSRACRGGRARSPAAARPAHCPSASLPVKASVTTTSCLPRMRIRKLGERRVAHQPDRRGDGVGQRRRSTRGRRARSRSPAPAATSGCRRRPRAAGTGRSRSRSRPPHCRLRRAAPRTGRDRARRRRAGARRPP